MSYIFYAIGLYLLAKCLWELYLYYFDRRRFEDVRNKVEDGSYGEGEDIDNVSHLFFAYPFLIGGCFLFGYLISVI